MKKNLKVDLEENKNILNLKILPFLISEFGLFLIIFLFVVSAFFIPQYHPDPLRWH